MVSYHNIRINNTISVISNGIEYSSNFFEIEIL